LNQVIGVDITHVPYRGGGPAMVDLIGGRIDICANVLSTAVQPVETAQVKALATLSRRTLIRDAQSCDGRMSKGSRTSTPIRGTRCSCKGHAGRSGRQTFKRGARQGDGQPAFRQRLEGLGLYVVARLGAAPTISQSLFANEIEKWAVPIRASGATGEVNNGDDGFPTACNRNAARAQLVLVHQPHSQDLRDFEAIADIVRAGTKYASRWEKIRLESRRLAFRTKSTRFHAMITSIRALGPERYLQWLQKSRRSCECVDEQALGCALAALRLQAVGKPSSPLFTPRFAPLARMGTAHFSISFATNFAR